MSYHTLRTHITRPMQNLAVKVIYQALLDLVHPAKFRGARRANEKLLFYQTEEAKRIQGSAYQFFFGEDQDPFETWRWYARLNRNKTKDLARRCLEKLAAIKTPTGPEAILHAILTETTGLKTIKNMYRQSHLRYRDRKKYWWVAAEIDI